MKRLATALALAWLLLLPTLAYAGTYLDTAAMLLDDSRRSVDWVERHLFDQKLAAVAHMLAEARVQAGRRVEVPKEVVRAHPHLLLVLETTERALAAAENGEAQRFMRLIHQAREEARTYRAILQQMHYSLPELDKSSSR